MSAPEVMARRALAMVATEAAMVREQDPARFAALERRNVLVGGHRPDAPTTVMQSLSEVFWLEAVDDGTWTPNTDCSNCLAPTAVGLEAIAARMVEASQYDDDPRDED